VPALYIHQGRAFGGMSLYTKAGKAEFAYNFFGLQTFTTEASQPIPAGKHQGENGVCLRWRRCREGRER
jgi:hypothetical protein